MLVTEFNSKSKYWDACCYYEVYEKNGELWIKFKGRTDRGGSRRGSYLGWFVTIYDDECEKKVSEMFEFDFGYQKDKLLNNHIYAGPVEMEPQEALAVANSLIKGNGNGSEFFECICPNEEDFKPGFYFG